MAFSFPKCVSVPRWVVLVFAGCFFFPLEAEVNAVEGAAAGDVAKVAVDNDQEIEEILASKAFRAWCECLMVTRRLDTLQVRYASLRDEVEQVKAEWRECPYARGGEVIGQELMKRLGSDRAITEAEKLMRQQRLDVYTTWDTNYLLADRQRAKCYLQLIRERSRGTSKDDGDFNHIRDELILRSPGYVNAAIRELKDGLSSRCTLTQDHGELVTMSVPLSFQSDPGAEQLSRNWLTYDFREASLENSLVRQVLIDSYTGYPWPTVAVGKPKKRGQSVRDQDEEVLRSACLDQGNVITSCEWTRVGGFPALFYLARQRYPGDKMSICYAGLWIRTQQQYVPLKLTMWDTESVERLEAERKRYLPLLRAIGSTMRVRAFPKFSESYQDYLSRRLNFMRAEAEVLQMKRQLAILRERYPALVAEADEAERAWDASPYAVGAEQILKLMHARAGKKADSQLKAAVEDLVRTYKQQIYTEGQMAILALGTEDEARKYLGFVRERSGPNAIHNPLHDDTVLPLLERNPRYFQNPLQQLADGWTLTRTLSDESLSGKIQVRVPISARAGVYREIFCQGVYLKYFSWDARKVESLSYRQNFIPREAVDEEMLYAQGDEAVQMYCGKAHLRTMLSQERIRVDGQPAIRFTDIEVMDRERHITKNTTHVWILGSKWHVRCSVPSTRESEGVFKALLDGIHIELRSEKE